MIDRRLLHEVSRLETLENQRIEIRSAAGDSQIRLRWLVRKWRQENKRSTRALAKAIGCSGAHLNRMEIGSRRFLPKWINRLRPIVLAACN